MTGLREENEIAFCLTGETLYGDDFSGPEIEASFKDPQDAYFGLAAKDSEN
jgi:hypothetical protein